MIKNLRGFRVDYLGPTNTLGARIRITDLRHGFYITMPVNHNKPMELQAKEFIEAHGVNIAYAMHPSTSDNSVFLLSTNFHELKGAH